MSRTSLDRPSTIADGFAGEENYGIYLEWRQVGEREVRDKIESFRG